MLDEIKEYEEYTCKIAPDMVKRFSYQCSVDNEGVRRALTIIARHALFREKSPLSPEQTIQLLNAWCGFEVSQELPEEYASLGNWYTDYLKNYAAVEENAGQKKKLEKSRERFIKSKKSSFNMNLFPVDSSGENDFNTIRLDQIIAEALIGGRLKRYIMVCKADPLEFVTKKLHSKMVKPTKSQQEIVLKSIAAILLQQHDGQQFVHFSKPDIANWLGNKKPQDIKFSDKKTGRPVYYYKGEALFSAHTLSTNNALKAAVNRNWMEDVMPELIEEAHFLQWLGSKELHKEYFIYRDCGSGRPLLRGRGSENF